MRKVKMQAMIQKFIDHGVSSTFNLPENVTEYEVSELYFAGWKAGLKGMTIYREGSRTGVLINKKKEEQNGFEYHDAPKRPRELPCDIFHPTIGGEKYLVLVGLYNGKPYEVFALKAGDASVPQSLKSGYLVKQKSKVYKLLNDKKEVIEEDIISKFELPVFEFVTRLISTALRHGADINYIIEQLNKSDGLITDVSKVIARTLKKYLKVQEVTKGEPCPQCGEPLVIEGGCKQCVNPACGWGKCS
jgi:ribonucleoside-diphosphate reductase alpha chain